jgi:arsenite methyltransferase
MTTPTPEETKACCAAAYGSDVAAMLLGDSYHPGGLTLTRHLADQLELSPGSTVLDIASGLGTTAMLLAGEFGVRVEGLELSAANVALAGGAVDSAGLADRVRFTVGDAERLPHPDARYDAVVIECALCTFPDKRAAASEIARVLRTGGRLGLTDVIVESDRLPAELTTVAARIACIADALSVMGYAELMGAVGLRVTHTERYDEALLRMIDQIEARLTVVRLTARDRLEAQGIDLHSVGPVLAVARKAVGDGVLGYGTLIAEKS